MQETTCDGEKMYTNESRCASFALTKTTFGFLSSGTKAVCGGSREIGTTERELRSVEKEDRNQWEEQERSSFLVSPQI